MDTTGHEHMSVFDLVFRPVRVKKLTSYPTVPKLHSPENFSPFGRFRLQAEGLWVMGGIGNSQSHVCASQAHGATSQRGTIELLHPAGFEPSLSQLGKGVIGLSC